MASPTDGELAAAARAGDRAAFGVLVERHYATLLRTCRAATRDAAVARDAAQEAVLRALLGLEALRDPDAFGPWLAAIGRNVCHGGERGRAELPLEAAAEPAAPGPEERADALSLRAAVAALPPGQREAVALFYLADLAHADVAARLGISVGAVKTRLHKARSSLRARLADLAKEPVIMSRTVPMHVADVRDTGGEDRGASHVVFLEEDGGPRRLPIWIGAGEGATLAARLHEVELPRPSTYRFTADLLAAAGAGLREVRVERLADDVFYARAVLADGTAVDARPSDAINLALVAGAPVLVEEAVLAASAAAERDIAEDLATALASPRDARVLAEELRDRMTARARGA